MPKFLAAFLTAITIFLSALNPASAQSSNLMPKYGPGPKNDTQLAADRELLAAIDQQYQGNRKKASEDASMRGWQFLRQGNKDDAMRRFNQAWLVDSSNGTALWGMAAIQAGTPGKMAEALQLFAEAEGFIPSDIDFSADYARAIGIAGAQARNTALVQDALIRFEQVHAKAPQHVLNLQNWAITLFYIGDYAEAWKKIILAEATPRHSELDPGFIAKLERKMPRP